MNRSPIPFQPWLVALSAALCIAATPACKGESGDGDKSADKSDDNGGDSGLGAMSPFAKMFADKLSEPGPYDERKRSADYEDGKPYLLVMELDKPVEELESISWFGGSVGKPLRGIQNALAEAAKDEKVQGLVLRSTGLSIDMALAEELRGSIKKFRDAGKSVHCHTEDIGNAAYHVMTACEKIGLSPLGDIQISGAAATPIHVKGLLDKFGVKADFLHVGAYKGAAEPITRDAPSPEMIETLEGLLDQRYATQVAGLVDGRGMTQEVAKTAIDTAMFVGKEAVDAGLADEVATWEDFLGATGKPWKKATSDSPFGDFTQLQRFVGLLPPDRPTEPHVALVYAVGSVIDGSGSGVVGARQEIASRTLVSTLRNLAKDDAVKGIVLRVSSGGGSARASELIWHAVEEVKKSKPVVVSMGGVAASGGYYIAAGATKIFAEKDTITGSIGVVGGKIVLGEALAQLGVTNFEVSRGKRALLWSSMRTWNEEERAAVQAMMDMTYEEFLGRVVSGRSMDREAVHTIAQGRVWTGAAAKEHGLVDEIGGLAEALAVAHELAGIDAGTKLEVYPGDPTLRDLLASFGAVQARAQVLGSTAMAKTLADLATLAGPDVAARTAQILETLFALRDTRVWALTWVQPLR